MSQRDSTTTFEANVRKLLASSAEEPSPDFEKNLVHAVLSEVKAATSLAVQERALQEGDDSMISRDSTQPAVRPDAHVPTELADGVSRETHPITQPPIRRHVPRRFIAMFQSKRARWSVAAAAAAAILVAVGFWPGNHGSGIAWADVVQRLRSAHTVTYRASVCVNDQILGTANYMLSGDHLARIETSNGLIFISDGGTGRGILLDSRKKTAADFEQKPLRFDLYQKLIDYGKGTETSLGARRIQGRDAVGFLLPHSGGRCSVWVDTQTRLPIQTEAMVPDHAGREQKVIIEDFVLDAPLAESLFSLSVPTDYTKDSVRVSEIDEILAGKRSGGKVKQAGERVYVSAEQRASEKALEMRSVTALQKIVLACIQYAAKHNGQWPESLRSLEAYGIDAQSLVNPRLPDAAVGWVYRRPPAPRGQLADPGKTVLIHEPLEPWSGEGIILCFADGHIFFTKSRTEVEELLGQ